MAADELAPTKPSPKPPGTGDTPMADEALDTREVTYTKTERLVVRDTPYLQVVKIRPEMEICIAAEESTQVATYTSWLLRIPTTARRIAYLGAGTCWLPRVVAHFMPTTTATVYELEQSLIDWNVTHWGPIAEFVPGRWQDTLTGEYDVIVYDTGEGEGELDLIRQHLVADGTGVLLSEYT